jgi:hypothetical protein
VDDPAVVAAIAAGDVDGLATALDRYAAALYDYCYAMEPAVAAEAVRDTFVIAWSSIGRLRDPAKLYPWLQAVAGHECFRRVLAGHPAKAQGRPAKAQGRPDKAQADPAPEPGLPPYLPGQVLSICADDTPVGRAYRVGVAYRAGPFGHDGFPKAGSWPRARRLRLAGARPEGLRGRRRPAAAVAAVAVVAAVLAAASTILASAPSGGPRHGRVAAGAAPASGADLPATSAWPIPSSGGNPSSPAAGRPRPSGRAPAPRRASSSASAPPSITAGPPPPGTLAKPPVVPMATVMPKPAPTATAAPGVLFVDQNQLHFVSIDGQGSTRTFVITAEDGPVTDYTIAVPPGLPGSLTVWPSSGSLAEGDSATITVTAASTVPFVTILTVTPGGIVIAVAVKAKRPAGATHPPHKPHPPKPPPAVT